MKKNSKTLYNQTDDYFKGFIVGALTVLVVALPLVIAVSLINYLQEIPRIIGIVASVFVYMPLFGRLMRTTEKFIRTNFEKANPRVVSFTTQYTSCNQKGEIHE